MKNIILGITIAAMTLAACSSKVNKSTESKNRSKDKQVISQTDNTTLKASPLVSDAKKSVLIKEIVSTYLQLKNTFANDNFIDAATTGTALEAAFKNFDKTALTAAQKKTFEDVEDDVREHAEHIGKNGEDIAHQREHFELLSNDIYDLVKTFGGGQVLYKDFDSMYNNGKGAFWLSETKEIKNPYMGKTMLNSGTIQEEIK